MNKYKIILLTLVFLYAHSVAFACSMPIYIQTFKTNKKIKSPPPLKPDFIVNNISRGERVRDNSSCFWLATLGVISLKQKTIPKIPQGYIFEIAQGKFKNDIHYFSASPIILKDYALEKGVYNFDWSDGDSNTQEPFDINVKITGVSRSGVKSKPQYLQISHKGVQVPWWNIWKKLPSSMTQVFEPDVYSQAVVK